MTNTTEFLTRALRHYAKRIKSFAENPDIKNGNDIIEQDIQFAVKEAEDIIEIYNMKLGGSNNMKVLCSAIDCYVHDLLEVRKIVEKRLADIGISIEYKNVDRELEEAKLIKSKVGCPDR